MLEIARPHAGVEPAPLRFHGDQIASWAQQLVSMPYAPRGRLKDGRLDCAGLVMATGACMASPVDIPPHWPEEGGDIALPSISLALARVGDVLIFDMAHDRQWRGPRWHMAIMVGGHSIVDISAKICHAYSAHACCISWLGPRWRPSLAGAHRFSTWTDR